MSTYIDKIRFRRKSDGKIFRVTLYSHWSDIQEVDGTEIDSIKWAWDEDYVSANKGHCYTKLKETET